MAQFFADPTGLTMGIVNEELFWGDAGIALAILGTGLGVAGIMGNGTPEQIMTWIPQCFGTPDDVKLARLLRDRARRRLGRFRRCAPGPRRTATTGSSTARSASSPTGGIADVHVVVATVDPSLGARGQASFVVPPGTPGLSMGKKERKMGIRASHTAEVIFDDVRIPSACLLGGEEKLEARLARAREGGKTSSQAAMRTFERAARSSAPRPSHRPGRLRVRPRLRQGAQTSSPGHHREPGHRFPAGRHGHRD